MEADGQPPPAVAFGNEGRPREDAAPISWRRLMLRLLILSWAAAIAIALLDEFGLSGHLPFLMAMAMTGMLIAVGFLITRDEGQEPAPASLRRVDGTLPSQDEEAGARDLLTELPTFHHFSKRLSEEFLRSRRVGRSVSVVLIDVNNLSAVNKEYGVRAGDEVLRHVARTIEATRRYNDVAARLGDDEFGVLLLDTGEQGITAFIDRLEDRLARESAVAEVNGRSISLWAGVCSGSAISASTITRAEGVLESAMASLNQAKQDRERRRRMWLSA
ncbi:MAG: GGDEF domain-containing protein [Chloroflexi bacterium]|nr:GGDEF domain-containing protein [Chloroflexota bacterium]